MALKGNAVLSELRLGLCSIGSEGITKLTETLKTIITEEGMSMFASNGDGSFHGVAVLNLDRNIIANQGGTALCEL